VLCLTSRSVGTFFAVATSICLKFAVGVAYFQTVWYKLRRNFIPLKTVDSTFDALGNVLAFVDLQLFLKMDYVVPIAVIVWYNEPPRVWLTLTRAGYCHSLHSSLRPRCLWSSTPITRTSRCKYVYQLC
jgi:hypothetical protein